MGAINIYDLRITFIWVRTILDFLKNPVPSNAPMAFLGNDTQYKKTFDMLHSKDSEGGLTPPWVKPKNEYFWTYYLEGTQPGDVKGTLAWKQLVPFRQKIPFKVTAPWFTGRIFLEGFFYPHGVALACTAESSQQLSLTESRDLAFKLKQKEQFEVTFSDGQVQHLCLNSLADQAMAFLCAAALGTKAMLGVAVVTPFTIWTVVRGDGVDPKEPTLSEEVHSVLEAVTTWNPNFATANLPPLVDQSAQLRKNRSAGDVLYANDRGRAIWFPGTFTLPTGKKRSLACYHRNLVYASMQVESLANFIKETAKEIEQPGDVAQLPLTHRYCAKRAAGILGRMYAAEDDTYRSGSPYVHIRQNHFVDDINKVREDMFMGGNQLT